VVGLGFGPRLGWLRCGLGQNPWPSRTVALFLFSFFKPADNSKNHKTHRKKNKKQTSFVTLPHVKKKTRK
jgi:hypothetical protein